ncbi:hypothetical protein HanRHA438_Chr06g0285271 [Helianthus annuus]|nr:hypothetical protein HanRHA438_Chr06g0285271 [Helianthus annuus]
MKNKQDKALLEAPQVATFLNPSKLKKGLVKMEDEDVKREGVGSVWGNRIERERVVRLSVIFVVMMRIHEFHTYKDCFIYLGNFHKLNQLK